MYQGFGKRMALPWIKFILVFQLDIMPMYATNVLR